MKIYQDMLHVYKVTSENINQAIRVNGQMVVKQRLIKSMMAIKEDTLVLLGSYFSKAVNIQQILDQFLQPLFTFVLIDYRDCHPEAREAEVLEMLATLINKAEDRLTNRIPEIFDLTFEQTLQMIDKNFEDYPDHRRNVYILLQSVANVCFPGLFFSRQSSSSSSRFSCSALGIEPHTVQAHLRFDHVGTEAHHAQHIGARLGNPADHAEKIPNVRSASRANILSSLLSRNHAAYLRCGRRVFTHIR